MKWLDILKLVGPVVLTAIPGVPAAIIPVVIHAIGIAEASHKSGALKKSDAIEMITDAIEVTNTVAKKEVIAPDVLPAVSNGVDAVVKTVNAIKEKS